MERAGTTLVMYLVQLPVILVWVVGIILALVFWRKHAMVSLLSLIALLGLLAVSLISTYLDTWLALSLYQAGMSTEQIGVITSIRAIITSLVSAGFWGLLIAALFGWRKKPAAAGE